VQAQQNLVPNPSFEVTDTSCISWGGGAAWYASHMVGWWSALNSMDYFADSASICLDTFNKWHMQLYQQPYNRMTYNLLPFDGNKYAGCYSFINSNTGNNDFREQIQCKLNHPLQINHYYKVSIKVAFFSLYNKSVCSYVPPYASSNIGIRFSNNKYHDFVYSNLNDTIPALNILPHIKPSKQLFDTNWVEVSSVFKADSSYTYMLLGSFGSDIYVDTIIIHNGISYLPSVLASSEGAGYYFFDDISVVEKDTLLSVNEQENDNSILAYIKDNTLFIQNNLRSCNYIIYNEMGAILSNGSGISELLEIDLQKLVSVNQILFITVQNNLKTKSLKYIRYEEN
jgi:hypothetical protein